VSAHETKTLTAARTAEALASTPHVGRSVTHEAAELHVTGAALYTDDLAVRDRGALAGWPVCAPHASAWLDHLDVSPALAVPGVVRVLTAADVPGTNDTGPSRLDEPLFPRPSTAEGADPRPEILFHAMPVAWVIAESEEAAKLGAATVVARYTPRTPILSIEAAIAAGAFHLEGMRIRRGEPEAALASAPHRLEGRFEMGGQEHFYLEAHASYAYVDEAGSIFVHASTQHPTETQDIVARVLGRPKNEVVVQQLRMGGGFGGKETQANPFASVAAIAAVLTKRPVRVRLDRMRDMQLSGKRHPFHAVWKVGFDDRGMLLGLDVQLTSDGGHSLDLSLPVLGRALFHIDNAYHLPNVEVRGRVAKTNKISNTAFRGFGGPQGMLVIEEIVDRIARTLGLAPEDVRTANLYRPGHTTHYEQEVVHADRLERAFRELVASSDFAARRAAITAFNAASPHTKRGLALTPVKFGISFTAKYYNQAGSLVLVYKDGSVQVSHGGTEMGQGLYTKVRQIAADALGVRPSDVRIMPTRTDKVPNTSATAASAGTDLNGAAVKDACDTIRARLAELGASVLECAADELVFREGLVVSSRDGAKAITFAELVDRAYHERIQLSANGFYKTPDIHYDPQAGRGRPFYYYAFGAAVAEVEVDGFTGMYGLRRVDLLHDVGDSISPMIDVGQIEGAVAQGAGGLTQEELVWDADGMLRTSNASTYKLPSLGECSPDFRTSLLRDARSLGVVHGSKAVGEPPFMLAFSVREALKDAIAAFGPPGGVVELSSPATAEAVYWSIEARRARG
jgi:xanthine dehydrogenase large subunit